MCEGVRPEVPSTCTVIFTRARWQPGAQRSLQRPDERLPCWPPMPLSRTLIIRGNLRKPHTSCGTR
jgi:hypothetical protein